MVNKSEVPRKHVTCLPTGQICRWGSSALQLFPKILRLMAEIRRENHLGWCWNLINNGDKLPTSTGECWILTDINSMFTKCKFNLVQKSSLSPLINYLYRTNGFIKENADVFQGKYLASIHVSPGDLIPIRPIDDTTKALLHCPQQSCNVCQLQAKGYTSHIRFYLSCRWKLILLDTYLCNSRSHVLHFADSFIPYHERYLLYIYM